MRTYVTFGQDHVHRVNGETLDKDCVACINGGRAEAFKLFGNKFCFEYPENYFNLVDMSYFPRGIIEVNNLVEEKNGKEKATVTVTT